MRTVSGMTTFSARAGSTCASTDAATIELLQSSIAALEEVADAHPEGDTLGHARHSRDAIVPAMNDVRKSADRLETMVADDLWPLPTYREMLFVK